MEESKVNTIDFTKEKSINFKSKRIGKFNSMSKNNKKEENNFSENIEEIKSLILKNKSKYKMKINKIQNEILILKSKISEVEIPFCQYTKKDLEQNLIKQKIISNTIKFI